MKPPARRHPARGGCLVKLLVFFVFAGAVAALAWMLFLPLLFTQQIKSRTGFDAEVASLAVNPFTGRVVVRGLVIANPPTFPVKDGLQLRGFEASADLWTCFAEKFVIDDLALDVRQLTLVKRSDGHTNLEIFQTCLAGPVPMPPSAKPHYLVRRLHLRLDTLVLADHSERTPRVREYQLGFDRRFENISDAKQLLVPDVVRAVFPGEVASGLAAFLPGDLGKRVNANARGGESSPKTAERKGGGVFRGFIDKLEEMRKP